MGKMESISSIKNEVFNFYNHNINYNFGGFDILAVGLVYKISQ